MLSPVEHAALINRLDTRPAQADWVAYGAWLETMLRVAKPA
jgi:hypothetical protein